MVLCDTCAGLVANEIRGSRTFIYPNLRSLRHSAASGCGACRLFFMSLQVDSDADQIDAVLAGKVPKGWGKLAREGEPLIDEQVWLELSGLRSSIPNRDMPTVDRNKSRGGSNVLVSCGCMWDPRVKLSGRAILTGSLDVFADPGTPAASLFTERLFNTNWNVDGHFLFAREQLAICRKEHPECRASGIDGSPEMPTRVLDVGSSSGSTKLVLARARDLREPYLALSYCWGEVVHPTMLNDSNTSAFLEFIDEDTLTAAHRECITIARQLGIRYVWIDALCIIQGNQDDWYDESKRMAEVYGNATLTVIAGRSADSHAGFMSNMLEHKAPPCAISLAKDMGDVFLCLSREMTIGPINTRGWCFQEKVLSRRTLLYAAQQVSFSCQRTELWEGGRFINQGPPPLRIGLFSNSRGFIERAGLDQLRAQMLDLWYREILPGYTIRQLSEPTDIFAAVSSIAQLAQDSIRSRYLAGIWEGDMARGLLWVTRYSEEAGLFARARKSKRPVDRNGKPVLRAPTWSWASVQDQVHLNMVHRYEDASEDPSNVLIRPIHYHSPTTEKGPPLPRWTALESPHCDADVLRMPSCELVFLARPKRMRCVEVSSSDLAGLPQPFWPPKPSYLADHGFLVALQPISADNSTHTAHGLGASSPLQIVALACLDAAEDYPMIKEDGFESWFLPVLKDGVGGLLLRRSPSDGKFRRLGRAALMKETEESLSWLVSGPEEEVHLV